MPFWNTLVFPFLMYIGVLTSYAHSQKYKFVFLTFVKQIYSKEFTLNNAEIRSDTCVNFLIQKYSFSG
jgi:hypothetical protein